jgi:hypothetical protein
MYEISVLCIDRGDHFYDSYSYERIGFVDDNSVPYLRTIKAPTMNTWPGCHMEGWPLFKLDKINTIRDTENLVYNVITRLLDQNYNPDEKY